MEHTVNCWPTPSNDGTCDVNIEYELENEGVTLYDVVISIPLPYVYAFLCQLLTLSSVVPVTALTPLSLLTQASGHSTRRATLSIGQSR